METHRKNLIFKLGVRNVVRLVKYAIYTRRLCKESLKSVIVNVY